MVGMEVRASTLVRDVVVAMTSLGVATFVLRVVLQIHNPTTVALALLMVVLLSATFARLVVAVATSVAAMLVLNYFFLPPVGTFTIADPHNWIALFAFIVTAVVASQLSSAAQQRAREAVESRREVARLFDLSRDILLTTASEDALPAIARIVAHRFGLQAIALCLPHACGWAIHQGGERDVEPAPDDLDRTFARIREALDSEEGERAYGGHVQVRDAAGRMVTLVPLRLGSRQVGLLATETRTLSVGSLNALGGVVAIAIERATFLAERKNAEALRQRAELASALLASLSHDLRTPLTAVRVAVANLQDPDLAFDDRQAQAGLALHELERLNRLFQDILDMARIDAAGITAEQQWVTPADIVDAALAYCSAHVANRRIDFDTTADVAVQVDPRLTSSALAHLIENAAMYSPAHESIAVSGRADADGLRLIVRDHGAGLDAADVTHLFERFYRGAAARQTTGGSGMGLAITRGLLAPEGGRVWGENAASGGASFTIVVPSATRPIVVAEV
jgi:two-component system, OmpR family, sensor histidine kinase KdpD